MTLTVLQVMISNPHDEFKLIMFPFNTFCNHVIRIWYIDGSFYLHLRFIRNSCIFIFLSMALTEIINII